jgi:peptide chain release factor 1
MEGALSFAPAAIIARQTSTSLSMALDDAMKSRLDGIRRSFQALTERLGDPDVIADSNLLRKVMKDRSQSEEVVMAYEEVSFLCIMTSFNVLGSKLY